MLLINDVTPRDCTHAPSHPYILVELRRRNMVDGPDMIIDLALAQRAQARQP